jgi:hypothetical protein
MGPIIFIGIACALACLLLLDGLALWKSACGDMLSEYERMLESVRRGHAKRSKDQ